MSGDKERGSLMSRKPVALIALDDGHGTETAGKRTPAFADGSMMRENAFNSQTAAYLKEALERCGFGVLSVAPEDTDTPLKTRVVRANDAHADAYISIHANAYGSEWNSANGVESIIYEKVMGHSRTYTFAQSIHDRLIKGTGRRDRGIKRSADLYVLKHTAMHAVLVECGFMTNREEAELLKNEDYRKKCAESICMGVCAFYQTEYIAPEKAAGERYNAEEELPQWAKPLFGEMVKTGCFGDPKKMDLSMDMIRTMVLLDRLWKKRESC